MGSLEPLHKVLWQRGAEPAANLQRFNEVHMYRADYEDDGDDGDVDNKTISDEGITVDFWFIKVHTSILPFTFGL